MASGHARSGRSALPDASTQRVVAPAPEFAETNRAGAEVSGSDAACHEAPSNQTNCCRAVRSPNGVYAAVNPAAVGAASVHAERVVRCEPSREKTSFQPRSPRPSRHATAKSPRPSLVAPPKPQLVEDGRAMRTGAGAGSCGPTPAQEVAPVRETAIRGSSEAGSQVPLAGAGAGEPDPVPTDGSGAGVDGDRVAPPHDAHSPATNAWTIARRVAPPPMLPPPDVAEI